jgi:hypothetical protein
MPMRNTFFLYRMYLPHIRIGQFQNLKRQAFRPYQLSLGHKLVLVSILSALTDYF